MLDLKNIKDPYKFIDTLYNNLSECKNSLVSKTNVTESYPSSNYYLDLRELDALSSIIKWMENYKEV